MVQLPATPEDSPLTAQDVMQSPNYLELRTPEVRVGDPAFDFTLPRLDAHGGHADTDKTVTLSAYQGDRPVALIFGSYT